MKPELVLPSEKYKESFLEALANESLQETSGLMSKRAHKFRDDFDGYLQFLEDLRHGKHLAEGSVAETVYWLVENNNFIGRVSIRHALNPKLTRIGGHIGYSIREDKRKKGYGSLILKLALPKAKELGIDLALLTCNKDNFASRRIIEKNGGILEDEILGDDGVPFLRFWVPTS